MNTSIVTILTIFLFFTICQVVCTYDWRDGQLPLERAFAVNNVNIPKNIDPKHGNGGGGAGSNFPPKNYYHFLY